MTSCRRNRARRISRECVGRLTYVCFGWVIFAQNGPASPIRNSPLQIWHLVYHSIEPKITKWKIIPTLIFTSIIHYSYPHRGGQPTVRYSHGGRKGSGRPGGRRTNNLANDNFYVHIISIFV